MPTAAEIWIIIICEVVFWNRRNKIDSWSIDSECFGVGIEVLKRVGISGYRFEVAGGWSSIIHVCDKETC